MSRNGTGENSKKNESRNRQNERYGPPSGGAGEKAASKCCVVCTYQGGFSPATVGHQGAGRIIANKLLELYPGCKIRVLFMPTANITSKQSISIKNAKKSLADLQAEAAAKGKPVPTNENASDYVSQEERLELLKIFCDELNDEFKGKNVTFEASTIEYELAPKTKSTSTIHTLRKLNETKGPCKIVLAMGEDNGNELFAWEALAEYPALIDKMLFVSRTYPADNAAALVADRALVTHDDLAFKNVAAGVVDAMGHPITHMRFKDKSPWSISYTINGSDRNGSNPSSVEKKIYTVDEIMSTKNNISTALRSLARKTYLLEAPPSVSSTALRKALRSGENAKAANIAGSLLMAIKDKGILTRTRRNVRSMIEAAEAAEAVAGGAGAKAAEGGGFRRTKKSKKSNKRRRL